MPVIEQKELGIIKGQATKAKNLVAGLVIETDEQYSKAAEKRVDINEIRKDLETRKKKITDPMNDALKEVRLLFKPAETQVADAIAAIDSALRVFNQKKAAEVRAKEEELRAQIASGEKDITEAVSEIAEVQAKPEVYSQKSGKKLVTRKIAKLNVFDESLIPREYLVVDNVAVRAALMAGKQVPGARMDEEVSYS